MNNDSKSKKKAPVIKKTPDVYGITGCPGIFKKQVSFYLKMISVKSISSRMSDDRLTG